MRPVLVERARRDVSAVRVNHGARQTVCLPGHVIRAGGTQKQEERHTLSM